MKREDLNYIVKGMALLSQFGLSFIMPTLICIGICWWLTAKLGAGQWVFIPGLFFGLGSSFMTAYKFYISEKKKAEKETDKKKVSFNQHS